MKVEIKIDSQYEETSVIIVTNELTDEVRELSKMLSGSNERFIVGFADGASGTAAVLENDKIIRIYSANQKVRIVTENGEYISKLRLYELEERLPRGEFVRVSNSEIVHLSKVKDFDLSFSGSICVRFSDNSTTYVSRRYVSKIKKYLGM
ncbi:MAG: LytTR family transcriptional regulator [Oscillospiraceae bacterium]|nr:LytTR family transcriptional regulator [Oscillospiraceae bacterium]